MQMHQLKPEVKQYWQTDWCSSLTAYTWPVSNWRLRF